MSSPNVTTRPTLTSAAVRGALLCLWLLAGRAHAAPCQTERIELSETTAEALLARARSLAAEQRYAAARYVYQVLIERGLEVRDARLGTARVDAWDKCYERAEAAFRAWLAQAPRDVEARAALIDVLIWTDRRDEAEREVEAGLKLDPEASELWRRRATLHMREDEPTLALRAAERALAMSPQDLELRALRDRIYFSQLRAYARLDHYFSSNYPDIHSVAISYWRRLNAFELNLDVLLVERSGGALKKAIVDVQYTAGVSYHFHALATLGAVGGFGAPNEALPQWLAKLWISSQWTAAWSTHVAYSMWEYRRDKTVHILAPVLTFTPSELLSFDVRYFGTWLVLHVPGEDPRDFASTVAARGVAQLRADLRMGLSYTYGAQLDQSSLSDFISLTSHVAALFADYRPQRGWGLQPLLSVEHREILDRDDRVWVASFELGAYVRW